MTNYKIMSPEKKRKLVRTLRKNKTEMIRFTMNMPVGFHSQILEKLEEKGYFMALARRDLND